MSLSIILLSSIQLFGPLKIQSQVVEEPKVFYDASKRFSVRASGTYISSAELQNNINSDNPIERDAAIELDGGFGYALELTFDPRFGSSEIIFFVSSEYFEHEQTDLYLKYIEDTTLYSVRFDEKFYFIPLEAGIKWDLPVSGQKLKIFIGGGAGIYFGDRKRTVRGVESSTNNVKQGYGLNVLSGIEYYIARNLSAAFEFKFREAYFEAESEFKNKSNPFFGMSNPLFSRIVVNGTTMSLGLKYNF